MNKRQRRGGARHTRPLPQVPPAQTNVRRFSSGYLSGSLNRAYQLQTRWQAELSEPAASPTTKRLTPPPSYRLPEGRMPNGVPRAVLLDRSRPNSKATRRQRLDRLMRDRPISSRTRECVNRLLRKSVLFAKRIAGFKGRSPGKGPPGKRYARTLSSILSCR